MQLAKYLEAADLALALAVAAQPQPPPLVKLHLRPLEQGFMPNIRNGGCVVLRDKKPSPDVPIAHDLLPKGPEMKKMLAAANARGDSVGILEHDRDAFHPHFKRVKPYQPPGLYRIRISLWSFQWDKGKVLPAKKTEAGSLVVNGRLLGYFDAPSLKSQVHEIVAWLNPGEEVRFNAASLGHAGVGQTKGRAAGYVGPGVAIDWFEVEGPLNRALALRESSASVRRVASGPG